MLADILLSTEATLVITALLVAMTTAVVFLHKALMSAKDEQIKAAESRALSYKAMADEGITHLEEVADKKATNKSRRTIKLAPVVPESNSPTTEEQVRVAELQTTRARLVAVTKELGLPPRIAAPMAGTPEGDAMVASDKEDKALAKQLKTDSIKVITEAAKVVAEKAADITEEAKKNG